MVRQLHFIQPDALAVLEDRSLVISVNALHRLDELEIENRNGLKPRFRVFGNGTLNRSAKSNGASCWCRCLL
jgi:hypothetical protein